jgi:hypothetical protein
MTMKNKHFNSLIDDLKKVSLTKEEKSRLFAAIDSYAEKNTVKKDHAVESPYSIKSPYPYFVFVWKHIQTKPFAYAVASIAAVVLIGGTSAFASQQSLPGDILYPIKVNIVEPLKVALAGSADARQKVEVALVGERLKEAETLAVQGRLASSTADNLEQAVVAQVQTIQPQLSNKNKDVLDVTLSAHDSILQSIQDHMPNADKPRVAKIWAAIHKDVVSSDQMVTVVGASSTSSQQPVDRASFPERKNKVQKIINDTGQKIRATIASTTSTDGFKQDILNNASSSIDTAQQSLDQAETNFQQNKPDQANALINVSEKKAQAASISVDQGLQLDDMNGSNNGHGNGNGRGNR